jgi:hypothetical protein
MPKPSSGNSGQSENNGLHLGQTLRDDVPEGFGNGLHLGQWMRGDGGLHLGQTSREPEPPPLTEDLIVNGDFGDPGVGVWPEASVPGWYIPGEPDTIRINSGDLFGPDPHVEILLTGVASRGPPTFYFGEIAQEVEATTGESYTLRWDAWFDFAALGPHQNGVFVLWNGQPVTGTDISAPHTTPTYWASFEAVVEGQAGTDTLTFRTENIVLSFGGSRIDNVSLVGVPDTTSADWLA